MNLVLSILAGAGLGAAVGYFGKCSSGACPLTANWWRGGLYGAFLGFMFQAVSPGGAAGSSGSTHNVKLIQEPQFEAEVAQASGPAVVDFFATWCGPCKSLAPMLDSLAQPLTNQVKFLKVDIDQSAKLAQRFAVEGVPTLIFFQNGQAVDRMVGLPTRAELRKKLESLASAGRAAATPAKSAASSK